MKYLTNLGFKKEAISEKLLKRTILSATEKSMAAISKGHVQEAKKYMKQRNRFSERLHEKAQKRIQKKVDQLKRDFNF